MDGPWFALPAEAATCAATGATTGGRAGRTRALLVATAAGRFAEDGYHRTALREILDEAGVTKGALYFHFASKLDLARAVCDEAAGAWLMVLRALSLRRLDPLQELLVQADAAFVRFVHDLPFRAALRVGVEAVELDGVLARWRSAWETRTTALFQRASDDGLLLARASPATLGRHTVALMLGHQAYTTRLPSPASDAWRSMSGSWDDVLSATAAPEWLAAWRASGWHERPYPRPAPDDDDPRHTTTPGPGDRGS